MFCPECGSAALTPGGSFCGNCGTRLPFAFLATDGAAPAASANAVAAQPRPAAAPERRPRAESPRYVLAGVACAVAAGVVLALASAVVRGRADAFDAQAAADSKARHGPLETLMAVRHAKESK